ncbi:MAG TPA: SUMF1/EgtB/PvdO family nonheme iron enzyme [Pyrinomonadaceae bacterium]|nr:SUMF1/EgtB/PvdO family nonheme iron enzyme [Pyrinomonadaceae bacterium]
MDVDLSTRNQIAVQRRTSRFVPFLIALTICAATSVTLGVSAWYLFGKNPAANKQLNSKVLFDSAALSTPTDAARPSENPPKEKAPPASPPGTLEVTGGLFEFGGTGSTIPAQKVAVDTFFISETEVTNEQYQEFVKATNRETPPGWKDGEFPAGAANKPVTNVKWQDAVDYCQWLSTKVGANVRLPLETEWELAARGQQGFKYPWGNDWDDRAAASENQNGFVHAVKSYPAGRSPFGAYDMAGNVWEWVGDVRGPDGKPMSIDDAQNRVIKGGAANEHLALISGTSRNLIPKDYAGAFLGFRYVVVMKS